MAEIDGLTTPSARLAACLASGETYSVEFKSEQRERLNDRDLVEAVVCLANGSGGVLLVGVEDNGTVTGARPRHESGRTDPLRVQALIANQTQPAISTTVSVVETNAVTVLMVEVPDSPRVVGTSRGTYVRRAVGADGRPTCLPYHAHEMLAHEVDRSAVDWARLPISGATSKDLDPLEFERLRRLVGAATDGADRVLATLSDQEIASALGLTGPEGRITTGALLLFGYEQSLARFLPTHEAAFQVLRGLEVETNDFFRTPLLRLSEELFARFRARNREEELDLGLLRVPVAAYSVAGGRVQACRTRRAHRPRDQPDVRRAATRERRATTMQLAQVLQRSEAEARHLLTRMVERGWVEARGEGKGRSWHLSAALYRTLEAPAGYVRTRGFEPLQQEQMILQYVDAHREIGRTHAADLCAITPDQAGRLLRRLVSHGKLTKHGERRWSTYRRPEGQA